MPARQLIFHDEARYKIRRGVDALAEAVRVTMGPRGRTVVLDREWGPPQIVNSGELVAKTIELEDRFENMGAQLLREVASSTSEMAGDGSTTVLAHSMVHEGLRFLAGGMNPMELKRGIERAIATVVAELQNMAQPCDDAQDIAHVATISANNAPSIGELVASAIAKVGHEGGISIEDGSGLVSVLEVVEDALHATRAAIEAGIMPCGGVALLRARKVLAGLQGESLDETSGIRLVVRALEEPLRRIVSNAGDEPSVVAQRVDDAIDNAWAYNAVTRQYGNLLKMGVINPAQVTRLAMQNAASIAALILTTDCMIARTSPTPPASINNTPPQTAGQPMDLF